MTKKGLRSERTACPIASALDTLGDKWTLLVVRDLLLFERHRFGEMLAGGEAIPTNILAERLARLQEAGLVERRLYEMRPPRYEYHLTPAGRDLGPVLRELGRFANRHIPGTHRPTPGMLAKLG
jgi:DNA-binding HxlR family transcriptional regulator